MSGKGINTLVSGDEMREFGFWMNAFDEELAECVRKDLIISYKGETFYPPLLGDY